MNTSATYSKSTIQFYFIAMLTKKLNNFQNFQKMNVIKTILSLFLLFNLTSTFAQSSSNKTELKVESDRNDRSTPAGGTYYKMILANSGQLDTFDLTSTEANEKGTNPDGTTTSKNVKLNIVFMDSNLKRITQLKVNTGETVKFFAHIEVPSGTAEDHWSINKVTATSKSNTNYKLNTVLNTKVISSDN
jgi:hypothetical protein